MQSSRVCKALTILGFCAQHHHWRNLTRTRTYVCHIYNNWFNIFSSLAGLNQPNAWCLFTRAWHHLTLHWSSCIISDDILFDDEILCLQIAWCWWHHLISNCLMIQPKFPQPASDSTAAIGLSSLKLNWCVCAMPTLTRIRPPPWHPHTHILYMHMSRY